MHAAATLVLALLLVAFVQQSTAQLSKADQAQCKSEMTAKQQAETDKDLAEKMAKAHGMLKSTVDLVQSMNDAQKDKLRNTYFTGVCAPIKDFYDL